VRSVRKLISGLTMIGIGVAGGYLGSKVWAEA